MIYQILLIVTILVACKKPSSPVENSPFEAGKKLGVNTNQKLEEASGLAASVRYPGWVWSHNDSGHPPELFLLNAVGETKATYVLTGIKNRDWEDIALGPGPDSTTWIYVGDIGDNDASHKFKRIHCLEEPLLDNPGPLAVKRTLVIRMADQPRDTEALMVDPISRNIYLVTKREKSVKLYEIQFPFLADTLTATPLIDLPLKHIVAGDISPDGTEILLKSYNAIYYWKRSLDQSISDAMKLPATKLDYKHEAQGESIAWAGDASGFYTLSENAKGERGQLLFYARKPTGDSLRRSPGITQ